MVAMRDGDNRELVFNKSTVSVWDDEEFLEMDDSVQQCINATILCT